MGLTTISSEDLEDLGDLDMENENNFTIAEEAQSVKNVHRGGSHKCFYKYCISRRKGFVLPKLSRLWTIPKTADRAKWINFIRSLPPDHVETEKVGRRFRFCCLHFEDRFVIKSRTSKHNRKTEIPSKIWKLTPDAYPTLFDPEDKSKDTLGKIPSMEATTVSELDFPDVMDFETEVEVEDDDEIETEPDEQNCSFTLISVSEDIVSADNPPISHDGISEQTVTDGHEDFETNIAVQMIENELGVGLSDVKEEFSNKEEISSEALPVVKVAPVIQEMCLGKLENVTESDSVKPDAEVFNPGETDFSMVEFHSKVDAVCDNPTDNSSIEEILIASDDEPSDQPECRDGTAGSIQQEVEVIELSDSEDMSVSTASTGLMSTLSSRRKQCFKILNGNSSVRVIKPRLVPKSPGLTQSLILVQPQQTPPTIVSTPMSPYVLFNAATPTFPGGNQPSVIQLGTPVPSSASTSNIDEPYRKVVILQQPMLSFQKPVLTPADLATLVMPTPDWNVNTYTEVFTISETILSQGGFEIIRKSISIISKNWTMKFSVYGFEVPEFSRGTTTTTVAEIQQIFNSFAAVPICSGLDLRTVKRDSFQKNMSLVGHLLNNHVDQNHRYRHCPLVIIEKSEHTLETNTVSQTIKSNSQFPLCLKCRNVKSILER